VFSGIPRGVGGVPAKGRSPPTTIYELSLGDYSAVAVVGTFAVQDSGSFMLVVTAVIASFLRRRPLDH